jgi:hypothetical protein
MERTVKFPLVEKVVEWKMRLLMGYTRMNCPNINNNELRNLYFSNLFNLRREMWAKPIPYLRNEARICEAERTLLAV